MNVFLDTNVVVDFLAERVPFFNDAASIVEMHRCGLINISISTLTVVNCAYILRKAYSEEIMFQKIKLLCDMFTVLSVDKSAIIQAFESKWRDFEDAVQFFVSLRGGTDVIVTRDKRGFDDAGLPVMTPSAFMSAVNGQE